MRSSTSAPQRRRRSGLLAGVAIVGVVVVAGGAVLVSLYNHVAPLPVRVTARVHDLAAEAGIDLDRPFAPSASLAKVNLPAQQTAVVVPRYEPQSRTQDLREIVAMQPGSHPPDSPEQVAQTATKPPPVVVTSSVPAPNATPSGPPPGFVPHEPGSPLAGPAPVTGPANVVAPVVASAAPSAALPSPAAPRGARDITRAVVAAATAHGPAIAAPFAETRQANLAPGVSPSAGSAAPAAAPAAPQPVSAPSSQPARPAQVAAAAPVSPDAAERALHLRASPMTDEQQVQVLELVTQMAAMVRDLKQQTASLRADFAETQADERARLDDFERRITLAEARAAISAATAVPSQPAPAVSAASASRPVSVVRSSAALPMDVPAEAKRYRVQAASPGLAMLTEVGRGGGDGAQLEVMVGDSIPGWGKVKSVEQRGTTWMVTTEHGVIE